MLSVQARQQWGQCEMSYSSPSYLDVEDLKSIKADKGSIFTRLIDRVIQYIIPSDQRRARILMHDLLKRTLTKRTYPFMDTVKLFEQLKSCAREQDKKRFAMDFINGRLVLFINLLQTNSEIQNEQTLQAEGAQEESSSIEVVTNKLLNDSQESNSEQLDSFFFTENLTEDEWNRIKSSYPRLAVEKECLSQSKENGQCSTTATESKVSITSTEIHVNAEQDSATEEGHFSLLDKPLNQEVAELINSLFDGVDNIESVDALEQRLEIVNKLKIKITKKEWDRIDVKIDEENKFVIKVYFQDDHRTFKKLEEQTKSYSFSVAQRTRMNTVHKMQIEELQGQTRKWKSESISRASTISLAEKGLFDPKSLSGWQSTDEYFKSKLLGCMNERYIRECDCMGDDFEQTQTVLAKSGETASQVKQNKIKQYAMAICQLGDNQAFDDVKNECGWSKEIKGTQLVKKVVEKSQDIGVKFTFKKEAGTQSELNRATRQSCYVYDPDKDTFVPTDKLLCYEDITAEVLNEALLETQRRPVWHKITG